jgi:hypothetical protein
MSYTPEKAVREAMEEAEAKKADKPKGRMMPAMEIEGKPPEPETKIEVEGREVSDDGDLYDKIRREPLEIKGDPDAELEPDKDAERLEADLDSNELVRDIRESGEEREDEMAKLQDDLDIDPQADREEQVKQAVEWLYDNKASNQDMQRMFSALSLYNNGRATWDSVLEAAAAVKSENPNTKERPAGDYKGPQAPPEE